MCVSNRYWNNSGFSTNFILNKMYWNCIVGRNNRFRAAGFVQRLQMALLCVVFCWPFTRIVGQGRVCPFPLQCAATLAPLTLPFPFGVCRRPSLPGSNTTDTLSLAQQLAVHSTTAVRELFALNCHQPSKTSYNEISAIYIVRQILTTVSHDEWRDLLKVWRRKSGVFLVVAKAPVPFRCEYAVRSPVLSFDRGVNKNVQLSPS